MTSANIEGNFPATINSETALVLLKIDATSAPKNDMLSVVGSRCGGWAAELHRDGIASLEETAFLIILAQRAAFLV